MHMKTRPSTMLLLSTIALSTASAPAALAQISDVLHLRTGRQTRGRVEAISATEITLDVRGAGQKVPVNDVRSITFGGEPSQLRRARDLIRDEQLQDALLALNQVDRGNVVNKFIRTDLEYYTASCQARVALSMGADLSAVSVAMYNFINDHDDSYHYFEAVETLGDLATALGKSSGAVRYYGLLSKSPWPELQMRGALLEARAYRSDGKTDAALKKYDAVIAFRLSTAEANRQQSLARVGRAACQAELGQAADAIQAIEQVIKNNDPQDTELFGQAYNALGACRRQMKQTQDALLAYLHVDLLFYQGSEAHAEALYYLSDLWNQLKKPERAVAARSLLKSRYPGSRWAKL